MQIKVKAFGEYQTNCYIVDDRFIIDPGVGAVKWVKENCKNPKAILLTHGHFDHVWSVKELKEELNISVYIHKEDEFLLQNDIFSKGMPTTKADVLIQKDETLQIDNSEIKFRHFSGHTPGSMTIEIDKYMFSGDFIFNGSIGRYDFPYSDANMMKNSLKRFLKINYDKIIYAGHGANTTIKNEQKNIRDYWLKVL